MGDSIDRKPRVLGLGLALSVMITIATCKQGLKSTFDIRTPLSQSTTEPKKEIGKVLELQPSIEGALNMGSIQLGDMQDPFIAINRDPNTERRFQDRTQREYPYAKALHACSRIKINGYTYSVVENDNPKRLHVIIYDGSSDIAQITDAIRDGKQQMLQKFISKYHDEYVTRKIAQDRKIEGAKNTRNQVREDTPGMVTDSVVDFFLYSGVGRAVAGIFTLMLIRTFYLYKKNRLFLNTQFMNDEIQSRQKRRENINLKKPKIPTYHPEYKKP